MTTPQRIKIMSDWWPAACRAQGWGTNDRALRLRVISVAVSFPPKHFGSILDCLAVINSCEALKRQLKSASELDSRDDVDRVKSLLLFLSGNLKAAIEMDYAHEGVARRTRHVIIEERLRCLALYPIGSPMGMGGAQALLEKLIRDFVNNGRKFERITLDDLSEEPQFYQRKGSADLHEGPSQLQRLIMRLDGLLNTNNKKTGVQGYRVRAGHSIHDMKMAAGLPCNCATFCTKKRAGLPVQMLDDSTPDWGV